ncbi:MAG: glycosyltransferase 87 family protein [Bacteroidia bacterium]
MSIKNVSTKQVVNYLLISLGIAEAVYLRHIFIDRQSADYLCCVHEWFYHIKDLGFFRAFKDDFSNYTPPYLYLLAFATHLPIKDIYAIKSVGFLFELLSAIAIYKIIIDKHGNNLYALWAAVAFSLCPTVILNGAWWSQCDIIFTCMLLFSFYYLSKEKNFYGYLFFAIAFAFKLQAIFALPVFIFLALYNFKNIKYLFLIPLVYVLFILPAVIAGRSFYELLNIYNGQAVANDFLYIGIPTVYALITEPTKNVTFWSKLGTIVTGILMILIPVAAYFKTKNKPVSSQFLLKIFMLSAIIIPFIAPHMHERYFFIADVFSILYVFYFRKNYFIPFIIIIGSSQGYLDYLGLYYIPNKAQLAWPIFVAVIFLMYDFFSDKSTTAKDETENGTLIPGVEAD